MHMVEEISAGEKSLIRRPGSKVFPASFYHIKEDSVEKATWWGLGGWRGRRPGFQFKSRLSQVTVLLGAGYLENKIMKQQM